MHVWVDLYQNGMVENGNPLVKADAPTTTLNTDLIEFRVNRSQNLKKL